MIDNKARFLRVKKLLAQVIGLLSEDIVGKNATSVIHEEDQQRVALTI
ncbi:MAG: PAS domain S-box protein [Candidatus Riflebacteria bacterium]|nr:PAS domain S-box protein [Candidatus Riflebacteria bacterium]